MEKMWAWSWDRIQQKSFNTNLQPDLEVWLKLQDGELNKDHKKPSAESVCSLMYVGQKAIMI